MIFAALLGLFTASASPTAPLSALPPPITELSAQADRVILGEVLTTRNARERDNAFTIATVRVWETLRGEKDPIVEVRLPGTMLDRRDLTVHGQAKLIPGFEVLLFLQGEQVVGMGAGAFVVFGDKAWHSKSPSLPTDPQAVGTHADSIYVSHDIDMVRTSLQ
jgi:hypothetical protein